MFSGESFSVSEMGYFDHRERGVPMIFSDSKNNQHIDEGDLLRNVDLPHLALSPCWKLSLDFYKFHISLRVTLHLVMPRSHML